VENGYSRRVISIHSGREGDTLRNHSRVRRAWGNSIIRPKRSHIGYETWLLRKSKKGAGSASREGRQREGKTIGEKREREVLLLPKEIFGGSRCVKHRNAARVEKKEVVAYRGEQRRKLLQVGQTKKVVEGARRIKEKR